VVSTIRIDYLNCSGIPTAELKALRIPPDEFMWMEAIATIVSSGTRKYSAPLPVDSLSRGLPGQIALGGGKTMRLRLGKHVAKESPKVTRN